MSHSSDIPFIAYIKKLFKNTPPIQRGDIGIYQDVLTINTINDGTHQLFYDIYAKVKAIGIYEDLVEIELVDLVTLNASNQEVQTLINANMPKYIHPKYIKWEIKP